VTGAYGRIPVIRDLQLSQALLYRQSTALRRRWMVERFQEWERAQRAGEAPPAWGRRGVLFGLATTFDVAPAWLAANPDVPVPAEIALVKTSFDRFPVDLCRKLVHAGWWLTGATLATYHPDVLPTELPRWRELP
jgi:NTE family protein